VAKAPPGGYTLLLTTKRINFGNPHLFTKLPYDALTDFTPIARVCNFLFILVVSAGSPIKSVGDLRAYVAANPGKLSIGYGNSTGQIAGAAFDSLAGLNALATTRSRPLVFSRDEAQISGCRSGVGRRAASAALRPWDPPLHHAGQGRSLIDFAHAQDQAQAERSQGCRRQSGASQSRMGDALQLPHS
jgi:hypothetical protein